MGDLSFPIYDDNVIGPGRTSRIPNPSASHPKALQTDLSHDIHESDLIDTSNNAPAISTNHRRNNSTVRSPAKRDALVADENKISHTSLPPISDQFTYTMRRGTSRSRQTQPIPGEDGAIYYDRAEQSIPVEPVSRQWSSENRGCENSDSASFSADESPQPKETIRTLPSVRSQRSLSYTDQAEAVMGLAEQGSKYGSPSRRHERSGSATVPSGASASPTSSASGSQPRHQEQQYREKNRQSTHNHQDQCSANQQHLGEPHQDQHVQGQHAQGQHVQGHALQSHPQKKTPLTPMQPKFPPRSLPPLQASYAGTYDTHRPRWEPPYLPPVGPHNVPRNTPRNAPRNLPRSFAHNIANEQPYWPVRGHPVSTYASPNIGSCLGLPGQGSFPSHPIPPPDVPFYASPRPPSMNVPLNVPVGPFSPIIPYPVHHEPAHAPMPPPRVDKPTQNSTGSSQRHSRSSRTRRRRHGSRHTDSMDARISSVALITPSYAPGISLETQVTDAQVLEKPPGGYYWAVMGKLGNSDDDDDDDGENEEEVNEDGINDIMLPIQMCQPPLRDIMPAYPQALEADPQPRLRKQSKYTAQQDRLILELKSNGETWAEIAAKAQCHNQLAARNRYQVLIGQQGSGTFFWTEEDCAALQSALDEAERAKWLFLAQELSRKRGRQFSLDAVHLKVTQMFASHPKTFGVIKTQDASRGGAPYKRRPLEQG